VRVPLAWLREFAPVELEAERLADVMTSRGLKVEGIERPWAGLKGVIVARVVDKRPHPGSDRLTLARLDTGRGQARVAAGVANWNVGDLVPYAPPGARVPALADPLSTRTLRGEPSEGMICSPHELAISADHGGILILPPDVQAGADVKAAFGLDDTVFDIEVKSNRPDLLSVVGVAREAAAACGVPFTSPVVDVREAAEAADAVATVRIDDLGRCPRYLARVIRGIASGPSPIAVQARLTAAGMRPLTNVVDATNYVMLEMGQPLHAFDLAEVAGRGIVVRRAAEGERLVTLDGVPRILVGDDLVIADLERGIAIAGVMGSALAEVSDTTTDVLLESAHFERSGVIRTSRRLDLRTEASNRFERGTDPEGVPSAAARAAGLMAAWAGGTVLAGSVDAGVVAPRRHVTVRPDRASMLLDLPISAVDIMESLARIGIPSERSGPDVDVEVPGFRVDLEREIDAIEEVIRVQGYDRVGETLPAVHQAGGVAPTSSVRRQVRAAAAAAGLRETDSYSFASRADLDLIGDERPVAVRNPLSPDDGFLRTSLVPGLLRAARRNLSRQVRTVALFEVGHVFAANAAGGPIDERERVAGVLAGATGSGLWEPKRAFDAFDAKGAVSALLEAVGTREWVTGDLAPPPPFLHPARAGAVVAAGGPIGVFGELHPRAVDLLDLGGPVAVFELDVAELVSSGRTGSAYVDIPRLPPVRRDLAFVLDVSVPSSAIVEAIEGFGHGLVDAVTLFDAFEGPPLPAGKKNVAFSVEFRAADRTLTDEEVADAVASIATHVADAHGGDLRTA
jgi:phenylalanyl-tRNA synthetase beta chain